ncbi:hypothetical protein PGT21_002862 [Puccinia graminis f. sp. tritici]|uniref:Uncharacterized protein n=1 Tax=Puccinia graminis f. sp. tritici TaxID=56615 RepID=A0A5B0QZS3_PUCGR|nr:hypothetical protein PGT21_002862 [Puccinia graminis f. sp. tritici]KAA1135302.1 hypothetical protein PGTUg99_005550 [Puccinia graminis f. sp. tritici]
MPATRSHCQNPISSANLEPNQVDCQSSMELMLPSDEDCIPASVPSNNSVPTARNRKIPNHLVLSPPSTFLDSQLKIQLTQPNEPDVPGDMMIPNQPTLQQGQEAPQTKSAYHVKMGNRYSCPRTPLRSAGSSSGLTPTINRWRHSGTESESSNRSPSIPDFTQNDFGHSVDGFNSLLSLSFSGSPNSDQNGKSGSFSTPTTLSPESCPSEAGSMYSNDSYQGQRSQDQETSQQFTHAPSPIIASPSCAPTRDPSNKSTRASPLIRNNRSRTASIAVTPSLVTEPTKTIQARRSIGQMLLFRRPSQLRGDDCIDGQNCDLQPQEEEKEELQTCVGSDTSVTSTNYFGDLGRASHSLNRGFNSMDDIHAHQFVKDGSQPSNEESNTPGKFSHSPTPHLSHEDYSTQQTNNSAGASTSAHRPKGLLKLVKSQSSLREAFFGAKRSQRSQSVQLDRIATNGLPNFTQVPHSSHKVASTPGDQPTVNAPRSSSESWQGSFSTYQMGKSVNPDPKIEVPLERKDDNAEHHPKRGSIHQSAALNIFKFWKKKSKNDEPVKPISNKTEPLEKINKKRDMKKSGTMKGGRPSVRIEQISSPILSQSVGSRNNSINTRPLLLSPKFKDSDPKSYNHKPSGDKEDTLMHNSPLSPSSFADKDLTVVSLMESAQIQNFTQASNLHLPKPPRPPRRRPVMMATL